MNNNQVSFATLMASSVHDIKNMLGSVMESIDWIYSGIKVLSTEQHNEFEKILQLVAQVNSELMQLLVFFKFEGKQYKANILEHDVQDFLDSQIAFVSSLIKQDSCTITLSMQQEIAWQFDEILLATALRNALINALKQQVTNIELSAQVSEFGLQLTIRDNGTGYPQDMLGKVEDKTQDVNLNSGGTGLGLYFAQLVAGLHRKKDKQGFIELFNDSGAVFSINIP